MYVNNSNSFKNNVPDFDDSFWITDADFVELYQKLSDSYYVSDWCECVSYNKETGVWEKVLLNQVHGDINGFVKEVRLYASAAQEVIKDNIEKGVVKESEAKDNIDFLAKFILKAGQERFVSALCRMFVKTNPVSSSWFDQNETKVVVKNGVLDLASGVLSGFDKELYSTRRIDVDYIKGFENDLFEKVLLALPDDCHEWMKIRVGQGLTGFKPATLSTVFLYGKGGNGKSAFLSVVNRLSGSYGHMVSSDALTARSGGNTNFGLWQFAGNRLATIEELPDSRFLDTGVLKLLNGSDTFAFEKKGSNKQIAKAESSIFVTINDFPRLKDNNKGSLRRLVAVPFTKDFTGADKNISDDRVDDLVGRDDEVAMAALAWAVDGAKTWLNTSSKKDLELDWPASVKKATSNWLSDEDPMIMFFDECLEYNKDYCMSSKNLFLLYEDFCKSSGFKASNRINFKRSFFNSFSNLEEVYLRKGDFFESVPENTNSFSERFKGSKGVFNQIRGISVKSDFDVNDVDDVFEKAKKELDGDDVNDNADSIVDDSAVNDLSDLDVLDEDVFDIDEIDVDF